MKVLFLDVDGVLNSAAWFNAWRATDDDYLGLREVDPECVRRILWVLERTGAKLVLSSTWRLVPDYVKVLVRHGLPISDMTPLLDTNNRGAEIAAWLHGKSPTHIAIVDDDADAGDRGLRPWLVQTSWETGLTDADADRLVALLQ